MNGQTEGTKEGTGSGKAKWVGPVIGVGLLAFVVVVAVGIRSFQRSRAASRTSACIGNLRQIDGAKEQAAMDLGIANGDTVRTSDIDPYIKGGTACMRCPNNRTGTFATSYRINVVGTVPVCLCVPLSHRLW